MMTNQAAGVRARAVDRCAAELNDSLLHNPYVPCTIYNKCPGRHRTGKIQARCKAEYQYEGVVLPYIHKTEALCLVAARAATCGMVSISCSSTCTDSVSPPIRLLDTLCGRSSVRREDSPRIPRIQEKLSIRGWRAVSVCPGPKDVTVLWCRRVVTDEKGAMEECCSPWVGGSFVQRPLPCSS